MRKHVVVFTIMVMVMLLPVSPKVEGVEGFENYTLHVNEDGMLSRDQSEEGVTPINKFGDWESFYSVPINGIWNGSGSFRLDLNISNGPKRDVNLEFRAQMDQDGDGAFEVQMDFETLVWDGSTRTGRIPINEGCVNLAGTLSDVHNGTFRLQIRQLIPYRDDIGLFCRPDDTILLPYVPKEPIADAGEDIDCFDGKEVVFSGNGSLDPNNDVLNYTWDFNASDGFQVEATGPSVIHVFNNSGIYIVTLNVSDGEFFDIDQLKVFVEKRVPPIAVGGDDITVFRNQNFTLNGSASYDDNGDELVFKWTLSDGTTSDGPLLEHSFDISGSYNATLEVTDGDFISRDIVLIEVSPNRAPKPKISVLTELTFGGAILFDGSGSTDPDGDPITEFRWDLGDGNLSIGMEANHTYLTSGDIIVELTVSDGKDESSLKKTINIPKNKPPEGELDLAHYFYDGVKRRFSVIDIVDEEGMEVDVTWDMGDGTVLDGMQVNHTYLSTGVYQLKAELKDKGGAVNVLESTIEVLDSGLYLPVTQEIDGNYSSISGVTKGYTNSLIEISYDSWSMLPTATEYLTPAGGQRIYVLKMGKDLIFNISVSVIEGGNIDVIILDKKNFDIYMDEYPRAEELTQMDWDRTWSSLNTGSHEFSYVGGSTRYLVIGNNGKMKAGASPEDEVLYNITIEYGGVAVSADDNYNEPDLSQGGGGSSFMCCLLVLFSTGLIVVALSVFGFFMVRKKSSVPDDGEAGPAAPREQPRPSYEMPEGLEENSSVEEWIKSDISEFKEPGKVPEVPTEDLPDNYLLDLGIMDPVDGPPDADPFPEDSLLNDLFDQKKDELIEGPQEHDIFGYNEGQV